MTLVIANAGVDLSIAKTDKSKGKGIEKSYEILQESETTTIDTTTTDTTTTETTTEDIPPTIT